MRKKGIVVPYLGLRGDGAFHDCCRASCMAPVEIAPLSKVFRWYKEKEDCKSMYELS